MRGKKLSYKERIAKLAECRDERQKVFKELLAHIRDGKSLDCFSALSEMSIWNYIKDYPDEFVKEDLEQAVRDAKDYWEDIGRRQSNGSCMGNSRAWYYNMANRYNWSERSKVEQDVKGSVSVSIVSYASPDTGSHSTD